jgi:hypothetical protein
MAEMLQSRVDLWHTTSQLQRKPKVALFEAVDVQFEATRQRSNTESLTVTTT